MSPKSFSKKEKSKSQVMMIKKSFRYLKAKRDVFCLSCAKAVGQGDHIAPSDKKRLSVSLF